MWVYYKLIRIKDFFRYDLYYFIKNLYTFRKQLWSFRDYDYVYSLIFLRATLEKLHINISNGYEEESSRNKKVQKIKRAIEILDNISQLKYMDMAEEKLNKKIIFKDFEFEKVNNSDLYRLNSKLDDAEKKHNKDIYELSEKIEEEEWVELWDILSGRNLDYSVFKTDEYKNMTLDEKESLISKIQDGSDMRGWWT